MNATAVSADAATITKPIPVAYGGRPEVSYAFSLSVGRLVMSYEYIR